MLDNQCWIFKLSSKHDPTVQEGAAVLVSFMFIEFITFAQATVGHLVAESMPREGLPWLLSLLDDTLPQLAHNKVFSERTSENQKGEIYATLHKLLSYMAGGTDGEISYLLAGYLSKNKYKGVLEGMKGLHANTCLLYTSDAADE